MFASKFVAFIRSMARPTNLVRLGLFVFLATALYFRLPISLGEVAHPPQVQAQVTCSSGKCEAAGNCWDQGSVAYNGDNGCKYTCSNGSWGNQNCNTSQQEKDTAKKNQEAYKSGGTGTANGGSSTGTGTATGTSPATTCGAGSASGCSGEPFYTSISGYVCFPNGVGSSGQTLCGKDLASKVGVVSDPTTGKPVGGEVVETNQANGGCGLVVRCGCSSGLQQVCLRDSNMLAGDKAAEYCARVVCAPTGTNGKVCTPGQVSNCNGTRGDLCNADGKGWTSNINAHACGATHTVAYCSDVNSVGACTPSATRYQSRTTCFAANCPSIVEYVNDVPRIKAGMEAATCAACKQGTTEIPPATSYSSVNAYCSATECANALNTNARTACMNNCLTKYSTDAGKQELIAKTGACLPGTNFRRFKGCGTGSQSKYNCYSTCTNGVVGSTCVNEPGLSCGAHQADVVTSLEERFTPTTPSTPIPSNPPSPTPTPKATCGQPCGPNAGGAYCTGSNMACVSGTCRSNVCAVSEQNSQCVCATPPPNPPICVDIYASKTNIALNDQVSFTCAQVTNAVSYQFRWGYTNKKEGTEGITMQELAPTSATSRTSVPITVDKVGRYIAQCRPCGANNLCSQWEPIDGENSAPELEPAAAAQSAQSASESTGDQTTEQNASTQSTNEATTQSNESTATESAQQNSQTSNNQNEQEQESSDATSSSEVAPGNGGM